MNTVQGKKKNENEKASNISILSELPLKEVMATQSESAY